ncbi:hypothetical protein [Chachezhania sediminis]|uniref:hypothetical protein n=1 Tax=Chachezhania sediminis TaxID=2599291 RepID=UPI00131BB647|nr:hypothetical protein [Chachezhania sediminis]
MPHMLEDFTAKAEASIAAMKAAAAQARRYHAAAELTRHMLLTMQKFMDRGKDAAVAAVVEDWMGAWHLDPEAWPEIAAEMKALTGAYYDYCKAPSDDTDAALRAAWDALKAVHDTPERTLEDQMAWRSVCAHGWWGDVSPAPAGYRDHDADRATEPFWDKACPPQCLGQP